jgi:hypothetical protein
VLVTLTNDLGKLLPPLATLPTSGQIDFPTGMQVAQVSSSQRQSSLRDSH